MNLITLLSAFLLIRSGDAQSLIQPDHDTALFIRADRGRSRSSSPASSAYSQSSDSSRSGLSAGSKKGGQGKTAVEVMSGRISVARKEKGQPPRNFEYSTWDSAKYFDQGDKSRTKVKGLTDDTRARMTISGGQTQIKMDARNGKDSSIGRTKGDYNYESDVRRGTKHKTGVDDSTSEIKHFGEMSGKGTMRGEVASKAPGTMRPTVPMVPGESFTASGSTGAYDQ